MRLDKVWVKGRRAILVCYGMAEELTDRQISSGAMSVGQVYSFVVVTPSTLLSGSRVAVPPRSGVEHS